MRRTITKVASLGAVAMFAVALAQPAQAAQTDVRPAAAVAPTYFEFTDGTNTFVFQLTDATRIQQARNILSGVETENISVMGKVVKAPASYNKPWKYQLAPNTVSFFGMAVEACDASIAYVNDHLPEVGGALLPGSTWCPWQSKLTREVTAP